MAPTFHCAYLRTIRARGAKKGCRSEKKNTAVAEAREREKVVAEIPQSRNQGPRARTEAKGFAKSPRVPRGNVSGTRFDYGGNAVHNPKWSDEDLE